MQEDQAASTGAAGAGNAQELEEQVMNLKKDLVDKAKAAEEASKQLKAQERQMAEDMQTLSALEDELRKTQKEAGAYKS